MSHEVTIHAAQTSILRELLFRPEAGFAELQQPTGLTSDHFNFHVKRLLELGLVEKMAAGRYRLSTRGKEHANKLDTDNNTIERQPKVAVLLAVTRERNGAREFLLQERLKQPYFGYWGCPTGKIRWGESVYETAARELMEETGLAAGRVTYCGVYHERSYQDETDELLEDKLFFVMRCEDVSGELTERFEGGRNQWMTAEAAREMEPQFKSLPIELGMADGGTDLREEQPRYTREQF